MYDTLDSPIVPARTDWPVVEEEDGVGRCRLCGIVAIIVGDQLCDGCKPEVVNAVKVPSLEVVTIVKATAVRVWPHHTGAERTGHFQIFDDRCHECRGAIIDGWCEDCGLEQPVPVEVSVVEEGRCPSCGSVEPAAGSTCPGPQDPIVLKGQARVSTGNQAAIL
jgi:hypothetical protein